MTLQAFASYYDILYDKNLPHHEDFCHRKKVFLYYKLDGVGAKLDRPLDDTATGFFIAKDIAEGKFGDHDDLVILKILVELAGCDQDYVQQLLDLRITGLGLI